jgi:redox-sensing transcriptional repressor
VGPQEEIEALRRLRSARIRSRPESPKRARAVSARTPPEPTLARLVIYLRTLRAAKREGLETLSSADIERRTGISSAQVRKDISHFGEFGKRGIGYSVDHALERLSKIMGLDREQRVVIVGAGNLGSALAGYMGFRNSGFRVMAVYDNDPTKIGRKVRGVEVVNIRRLPQTNRKLGARIGIIATPAAAAQGVAEIMARGGIKTILNFAPTRLRDVNDTVVRNVDLTQELEILCYFLSHERKAKAN